MRKHYDVCVAGYWYSQNYGSLLNGFATYSILKDMGKSVLMLNKLETTVDDPELRGHNIHFINQNYDSEDISPLYRYSELKKLNELCDVFCAGSDQIWNHTISFHENMYLPFVNSNKKIISFCTSFGHAKDLVPKERKCVIRKYLERYSAISVREKFDVDILHNNYGLNATLLFEPALFLKKERYDSIASKSKYYKKKNYFLVYILNATNNIKKAIEEYSKLSGLKAIIIVDGYYDGTAYNTKILGSENILTNVEVADFLALFKNSDFILTDSFHGTVFSVYYAKPFISIPNLERGRERFDDFLSRVNLLDHLVDEKQPIPIDKKYLAPLNKDNLSKIIDMERDKALSWLKNALDLDRSQLPKVIDHVIYADLERARILVSLLKSYEVKHIVISSGTRNVSIARLFESNQDYFKLYYVTDERSAAYFAIGISTYLKKPVAICCTSGTAVSNYVPGVTEAFYQNVPLVVITADRHPSFIGNLEDQTIVQYGLFNTITKKAVTLPVGLDVRDMWETKVKVCDALLELNHHGCGPVQINVPQTGIELRPSPEYAMILPEISPIVRITKTDEEENWTNNLSELSKYLRILIIYGQAYPLDAVTKDLLTTFVKKTGAVIVADHLSNLDANLAHHPFRMIESMSQMDFDTHLCPDLVIHYGGKRILNCPFTTKIRNSSKNINVWRIAEDGKVADLYRRMTKIFECSLFQFLEIATNQITNPINVNHEYQKDWNTAVTEYRVPPAHTWNSYVALSKIVPKIPSKSILHLAVGNTFIHTQSFNLAPEVEVFCNMGTNGIDGCASSFMGQCAVAADNQLCFLLIGDLSFFYDMNSLWNKQLKSNMRILLNNDHGGGLLRYMKSPALTQQHSADAEGWVKSLGFEYISAHNMEEYMEKLDYFTSTKPNKAVFFEVFVP